MILNLLSYNIRFGGGDRQARLAEVIQSVAPDIVVFQEATNPDVIQAIASTADFPLWAARPNHSTAFMSRVPIAHHEWHFWPGARHSFLEIVLGTGESRIFGLHLSAMFSRWSEERRVREIRALLKGIEQYQSGFHVLVGDFNTLAPGEVLQASRMPAWIRALIWVSGRDIQRHTIQVVLDADYADGFRTLTPVGDGSTFPTWDPHVRLDYVFLPKRYADRIIACHVVREAPNVTLASDHFPLYAQLELPVPAPSAPAVLTPGAPAI